MKELLPFYAVVVFLSLTGLLVWWAWRWDRRRSQEREQRAMERGWSYSRGGRAGLAYSAQGAQGGDTWVMEVWSGGKRSKARTFWKAPDVCFGGGGVFAGPKRFLDFFKSPFGRKLFDLGVQLGKQEEPALASLSDLLESGVTVDVGDPEFGASYAVLASDSGQALRLFTADVRQAILAWGTPPGGKRKRHGTLTVAWTGDGLLVNWDGNGPYAADDVCAFVDLGLCVLESARGRW